MRITERPFSDLLRHPKAVTVDVEDGDVLLRRRDEPDLRLTRADREADRETAFAAFGRTLRNLAVHNPRALEQALGDAFPWIVFLAADDRRTFVDEFSVMAAAVAEMGTYGPLSQFVREWRATAEIEADPRLGRQLRRALVADGEPIRIPG